MAEGFVPGNRTPCGKCCRQRVRVSRGLFGDDPSSYRTKPQAAEPDVTPAEWARGDRVLTVKPDGHCTYLSDDLSHCTIYARRPFKCRDWLCDPRECLALQGLSNG